MLKSFENRDGWIWMNGKIIPWKDANSHVISQGLHYASAVFEGERAYNGKIFKSEEHTKRFFKSAEIIGMEIPFTHDQINKAKYELIDKMNYKNCYVRPLAWRGGDQMGLSTGKSNINVAIAVWDDKRLRELLKDYLTEKNLQVYQSEDYNEAKEILSLVLFDLIILDRMMPSGDGIELIEHIKQFSNTPIIMLTAMGEDKDKIDGLKIGADDYLSKPFEPEELFLRIKNLLDLFENLKNKKIKISFGEFTFDTSNFKLQKNDRLIYLTEGENNLLVKLINKRNDIVLREELADQEFDETELRKVDVQVTRLRQKIETNAKQPQFIKTIRGKGYKLICNEI